MKSKSFVALFVLMLQLFPGHSQDTLMLSRSVIENSGPQHFKLHEHINFEEDGKALASERVNILGCERCTGSLYIINTDTLPLGFMINIYYAKVTEFRMDGHIIKPSYQSSIATLYPIVMIPGRTHHLQFSYSESSIRSIYIYAEKPQKYDDMLSRYVPTLFDSRSFIWYGFLGVLLLSLLFGLFQFAIRRDRFLLYYAGFVLFFGTYFLFLSIIFQTSLYTNLKVAKTSNQLLPVLQALYILMYLLFVMDISRKRGLRYAIGPLMIKAIGWCIAFILVYLSIWLFKGQPEPIIADIFRLGFITISVFLFYYTWRNKDTLLNIVSIGAFIFFITNLILYFQKLTLPIIRQDVNNLMILIAGGFCEIVIFGIAIAYQTNEINREKIQYLEALDESNRKNKELAKEREQELKVKIEEARKQIEASQNEKIESLLKIQMNELEKQALRSQINPHFLFNSLNSLKMFIHKHDKESALTYIDQFAGLLRRLLENTFEKRVTLSSELELLRWYVELENLRLDEKIVLSIHVDNQIDPNFTEIPSMVLQPFIENAIWHGLAPQKSKNKTVSLYFSPVDDKKIAIQIEDNGIGISESQAKKSDHSLRKSLGIQITKQRLDLLNTTDSKFKIEEIKNSEGRIQGTRVNLLLEI